MKTWDQLDAIARRYELELHRANSQPGVAVTICSEAGDDPMMTIVASIEDNDTADEATRAACEAAMGALKPRTDADTPPLPAWQQRLLADVDKEPTTIAHAVLDEIDECRPEGDHIVSLAKTVMTSHASRMSCRRRSTAFLIIFPRPSKVFRVLSGVGATGAGRSASSGSVTISSA